MGRRPLNAATTIAEKPKTAAAAPAPVAPAVAPAAPAAPVAAAPIAAPTIVPAPVRELTTGDNAGNIEQKPDIVGDAALRDREPEIVSAEQVGKAEIAQLAFNEEPVTVILQPSSEKNAAKFLPVWVNGKGCEVWSESRRSWLEIGYLPVATKLTIKRKYLEVIIRAKLDTVSTDVDHRDDPKQNPVNRVTRFTTPLQSVSVLHDANPLGAEWLVELYRRNM